MGQKGAGLIGLLIVIVIVALFAYGGYSFYDKDKKVDLNNDQEIEKNLKTIRNNPVGMHQIKVNAQKDIESINKNINQTNAELEGWEIYFNNKYNFLFKYPQDLKMDIVDTSQSFIESLQFNFTRNNQPSITFTFLPDLPETSNDFNLAYEWTKKFDPEVKKIKINDLNAISYASGNNIIIFKEKTNISFKNEFNYKGALSTEEFKQVTNSFQFKK